MVRHLSVVSVLAIAALLAGATSAAAQRGAGEAIQPLTIRMPEAA